MNQFHRGKQAVIAFVAALLLALSILGGSVYAGDDNSLTTVAGGVTVQQPCWLCGSSK